MASSRVLLLTLVAVLVGCTGAEAGVSSLPQTEGSVGVLHVERVADDLEGRRTVLSAAFARYRGIGPGGVAQLLGSGSFAELESCAYVGPDDAIAPRGAEVELLDVGAIEVGVAGTQARLSPRPFPDLASVLAGVFYAGEADLAVPRADADEYRFVAAGSAEVASFDALVPAPGPPLDVRVSDIVSREGGLDVAWAAEDPRDLIEVDVLAGGERLACVARDDGSFRIDPAALGTLAADPAGTLTLRRVRVSPVDVPGIDEGYARVAVSRSFALSLR